MLRYPVKLTKEGTHVLVDFSDLGYPLDSGGYLAVSSGTITDDMIKEYIDEQQGEQIIDDSRFPIDSV